MAQRAQGLNRAEHRGTIPASKSFNPGKAFPCNEPAGVKGRISCGPASKTGASAASQPSAAPELHSLLCLLVCPRPEFEQRCANRVGSFRNSQQPIEKLCSTSSVPLSLFLLDCLIKKTLYSSNFQSFKLSTNEIPPSSQKSRASVFCCS